MTNEQYALKKKNDPAWHEARLKRLRANRHDRYWSDPEKARTLGRVASKKWRDNNPEKARLYTSRAALKFKKAHPESAEKAREYARARYKKDPNKILDRTKKWRRDNPESDMFQRSKIRAKRKGFDHTITIADVVIPERCPIYNQPFAPRNSKSPWAPSLDRIENSKGYVPGNVAVISVRANANKGNMTLEQARALVRYMESAQ